MNTATYEALRAENKALKEELLKLKKESDYNGHYNAFLLGTISEDEFKEITEAIKKKE